MSCIESWLSEVIFSKDGLSAQSFADRPDLGEKARNLDAALPEFMGHDVMDARFWHRLHKEFADFQFSASRSGEVIAAGYTVPATFDNDELPEKGWGAALSGASLNTATGSEPSALCALLAVVSPAARGSGISQNLLAAMKSIAECHGFDRLFAPVRPSLKHLYPLTPMERYIAWRREDGTLFDPWMRVHERIARIVKVAPESMNISGTVAEWEEWTGMSFPESGAYVVKGALCPVEINVENDIGTYIEPNVWMIHEVS